MIELNRHIEALLLTNDCVIIPDFGGFVAHHIEAYYDEDDHVFLPPKRILGFNSQLKMNDSLLVQSYIETYDISYPEALHRIEDEVEELKDAIDQNGAYELNDIGTLFINHQDTIEFEPIEGGVLTPSLYGFSSFEFDSLNNSTTLKMTCEPEKQKISNVVADGDKTETESDSIFDLEEKAIRIKMSWIHTAVATVAAIIMFFLFATPISNGDINDKIVSDIHNKTLYSLLPKDTNKIPQLRLKKQENVKMSVEASGRKSKGKQETDENSKQTVSEVHYYIVLASQVKKKNAEAYVDELKGKGYKDTRLFIKNNVIRVVYGDFKTEADAYNQLNNLQKDEYFIDAWVYKTIINKEMT